MFKPFCFQVQFFFARARAHAYGGSTVVLSAALLFAFLQPVSAAPVTFEQAAQSLKNPNLKTKYAAIRSLQAYRTVATAKLLANTAARENNVNFRLAVLDEIATLGFREVIPQISPLLTDKNIAVRKRASRVVSLLGGPEAEKALLQTLPGETNPMAKTALLQGLDRCGSKQSEPAIQAALSDKNPHVRKSAERAMKRRTQGVK